MDAWKKEQLAAAGINVAGVLKRFVGNEAPLERMLQRFTGDADYAQLMEAAGGPYVEGADRKPVDDGAVSAVHPPGGVGTRTRLMLSARSADKTQRCRGRRRCGRRRAGMDARFSKSLDVEKRRNLMRHVLPQCRTGGRASFCFRRRSGTVRTKEGEVA